MHRSFLWRLVLPAIVWIGSLQLAQAQQPAQGGLRAVQRASTQTREDSLRARQDSLQQASDQAYVDSLRRNSKLTAPVKYTARDSLVIDRADKRMRLYGKATMDFEDKALASERMTVDQSTNTIQAVGIPDTADLYNTIGRPIFNDAGTDYETDTIRYNFTTKRGTIVYTRTQQGENVLIATKIRREPEGFFYAAGTRFTTCDDPSHPHYYIRSNRVKFIPNDKIVTGPFQLVVGDVPLPFAFPFGFFPNRIGRNSGILFPTFGDDANRGFNLREGGFYFAPNDFLDFTLRGDIYSNTSWALRLGSRYVVRYRLQGNLLLQYADNRLNTPGDPDFSRNQDFRINWTHTQDITPNMRFNANVNAGTTTFDRRATNNVLNVFNNTLASSISFNHTLPVSGWNYSVNANHSQNSQTGQINLSFPSVTLTRTQPIQPFAWLAPAGLPTWYSNITLSYTAQIENQVIISERNFGTQRMLDSLRNGMVQRLGLATNLRVFNVITLTPSLSYNEYWYLRSSDFRAFAIPTFLRDGTLPSTGDSLNQVVRGNVLYGVYRQDLRGFRSARDFAASLSANTRIYGVFRTRWANQAAFRHSIIPTLTYSWRPDFAAPEWGYFRQIVVSPGTNPVPFNRFSSAGRFGLESGVVSSPGGGPSQLLNFSLQNLLEMRYLPQDSAATRTAVQKSDYKYINLLDDVSLSGSYNMVADSFRLSTLALTARTNLLNNMVNLQVSSQVEPYQEDNNGRVNRLRAERFVLGRPSTWSVFRVLQTSFNLGLNLRSSEPERNQAATPNGDATAAPVIGADTVARRFSPLDAYRNSYAPFRLPWTISLNYNISIRNFSQREFVSRQRINPLDQTRREIVQTLNGNFNVELGPNWRVNVFTGWDFTRSRIVDPTLVSITRNLHCWEFNFNASPFGTFRYFNFQINVKTGNLRDLRLQKRRDWRDSLFQTF